MWGPPFLVTLRRRLAARSLSLRLGYKTDLLRKSWFSILAPLQAPSQPPAPRFFIVALLKQTDHAGGQKGDNQPRDEHARHYRGDGAAQRHVQKCRRQGARPRPGARQRDAKPAPAAPHRNEKSALPQQRAFQTPKGPVSCRQPIQQTARQKGEQRTVNNDSLFTFHFSPLLSIVPSRWGNRLP